MFSYKEFEVLFESFFFGLVFYNLDYTMISWAGDKISNVSVPPADILI